MQIYVHRNNQQLGPFTEAEIKAQLAAGTISPQDHVWWQGQSGWVPLGQTQFGTTGVPSSPAVPSVPGSPVLPGVIPATGGVVQPTSNLAIWSLVCGCVSVLCGIFASIPAIILGHMALSEIKKNPGVQGRGMAIAGTIMGYVFTLLIVAYLSIFGVAMLVAVGSAVKDQQKSQIFTPTPSTNSDESTTTNSSDDSTNSAPASTNSPDQSTNNAPASTNSADTSTNAAPSTNAPADSTNTPAATPMSQ
jgi:hypothetical protein